MVHYNNRNSLHQIFTLKGTIIRDIFPQIVLYTCISTIVAVIKLLLYRNKYKSDSLGNRRRSFRITISVSIRILPMIGTGKVESCLARLVLVLEI